MHSTYRASRRKTAVEGKVSQQDSGACYEPEPCIELRLAEEYLSAYGVVFGHGQDCDVVLDLEDPHSAKHFCITPDAQMRLIVQGLDSTNGTEVAYYGLSGGMRRNLRWIIGGYAFTVNKEIVSSLTLSLNFRVVVNQAAFMRTGTTASLAELFFRKGMKLGPATFYYGTQAFRDTRAAVSRRSPDSNNIQLLGHVDGGGFGNIRLNWDVSTGKAIAIKSHKFGMYDENKWLDEVKVVSCLKDNVSAIRKHHLLVVK